MTHDANTPKGMPGNSDASPPVETTGDRAAHARNVEVVYREHYDQLIGVVRKYGHPFDRAEEIVQHAFLKVLAAASSSCIESARRIIFTAARNLAIDAWRQRDQRRNKDEMILRDAHTAEPHPSSEAECMAAEHSAILQKAIEELPEQRRLAARMITEEDLSKTAVAKQMNVSIATLTKWLLQENARLTRLLMASKKQGDK